VAKAVKRHTEAIEKETSADRAARLTANATKWIAFLTAVLVIIASLQLYEIIEGGKDTTAIANAAKQQAYAAHQIAEEGKGDGAAETAGAAGYQDDFVGEFIAHGIFPRDRY